MNDIVIPVAPLAVMTLIGFIAPYVIAALNGVLPFVKQSWQRKVLSVVVSVLLGLVGLVGYFLVSGDSLPTTPANWVGFVLLVIVVCQASYNLITKNLGVKQLEAAATPSA